MKMRIVSSKDEISKLSPNEKVVHFAFRPSNEDIFLLIQKCPEIQCLQIPKSYSKTISNTQKMFLEHNNILFIVGDVWGYRKDLCEYIDVSPEIISKINSMNLKKLDDNSVNDTFLVSRKTQIENNSQFEQNDKRNTEFDDEREQVENNIICKKNSSIDGFEDDKISEIEKLKQEIVFKNEDIDELKYSLRLKQDKIKYLQQTATQSISSLKNDLSLKETEIQELKEKLGYHTVDIPNDIAMNNSQTNKIKELEYQISEKDEAIGNKDEMISILKNDLSLKETEIQELKEKLEHHIVDIQNVIAMNNSQTNKINELEYQLSEKDKVIDNKDEMVSTLKKDLSLKETEIQELKEKLEHHIVDIQNVIAMNNSQTNKINELEYQLSEKDKVIGNKYEMVSTLKKDLSLKETEIQELKEKLESQLTIKDEVISNRDEMIITLKKDLSLKEEGMKNTEKQLIEYSNMVNNLEVQILSQKDEITRLKNDSIVTRKKWWKFW